MRPVLARLILMLLAVGAASVGGLQVGQAPIAAAAQAEASIPAATPAAAEANSSSAATTVDAPGSSPQSATPPAGWLDRRAEDIETLSKGVKRFTIGLAEFLAALLVIALILLALIPQVWRLLRRPLQLVVEDFTEASGDPGLKDLLPGLSQEVREQLPLKLEAIRRRTVAHLRDKDDPLAPFPPPDTAPDASLADLLGSLKALAPAQFQSAVQLLAVAFPPRGTKVTAILQRRAVTPDSIGTIGISIQVSDLRKERGPTLFTIWDTDRANSSDLKQPSQRGAGQAAWVAAEPILDPAAAHAARSSPVGSSSARRQAEAYCAVGGELCSLSMFSDGLAYFELALETDRSFKDAAAMLAAAISAAGAQQQVDAAYATGAKQHAAGLPEPALASYVQALPDDPPIIRSQATANWRIVLRLPGDNPSDSDLAAAYLILAELYGSAPALLPARSLELYRHAIAHGSASARVGLAARLDQTAVGLARAGHRLVEVGRYADAEKYLMVALGMVPGHRDAEAAMATLKRSRPAPEDKDALASYTLGAIYEQSGALDLAKTQYEEALKKQPEYLAAREALQGVLARRRTLATRYADLLTEAVIRRMATELAKQKLEADVPRRRGDFAVSAPHVAHELAKVANFVGGQLHQASGLPLDRPYSRTFLEAALADFQRAIEFDPAWHLPYENLADTYNLLDRTREAIPAYKEATTKLATAPGEPERAAVGRRIAIKLARARLKEEAATGELTKDALTNALAHWRAEDEQASALLYNVGSVYALIAGGTPTDVNAAMEARTYLAYAVARGGLDAGRRYWRAATGDPDFNSIRAGWDKLEDALWGTLRANPGLSTATGESFKQDIAAVLTAAGWGQGNDGEGEDRGT